MSTFGLVSQRMQAMEKPLMYTTKAGRWKEHHNCSLLLGVLNSYSYIKIKINIIKKTLRIRNLKNNVVS